MGWIGMAVSGVSGEEEAREGEGGGAVVLSRTSRLSASARAEGRGAHVGRTAEPVSRRSIVCILAQLMMSVAKRGRLAKTK